jgi:hypothetical protein
MAAKITQIGFNVVPPTKDGFGGAPWKGDANLAILADRVMSHHAERFRVTRNFSIEYLWRAKGGTSRGEPKLGDCVKLGGLAYHFSSADFVIWFAADHLADFAFTERMYEALMFRMLMHIGANENTSAATLVPFDFKGFNAELAAYGPWDEALKKMSQTLQPTLFDGDPSTQAAGYSAADDAVQDVTARREERAEAAEVVGSFTNAEGEVTNVMLERGKEAQPAEVQSTEDVSAAFMASMGWEVDPTPSNGLPHSESDAEAERAMAGGRRRGVE